MALRLDPATSGSSLRRSLEDKGVPSAPCDSMGAFLIKKRPLSEGHTLPVTGN